MDPTYNDIPIENYSVEDFKRIMNELYTDYIKETYEDDPNVDKLKEIKGKMLELNDILKEFGEEKTTMKWEHLF